MKSYAPVGSRVRWTYKHHLNSKSYTYLTKDGTLLSYKKSNISFSYDMAIVKFDGNKTKSKVRLDELVKI